jgi:outer membrane receptor protein involved in Fe transport
MLLALLGNGSSVFAEMTDFTELSLEDLLEVKVVGASKYEQSQDEIAASVSVLTRADIKAHGWQTIDQALESLPGIYTTYDRQYSTLGTRGFGLPGDFNTRILMTIDGNRVNEATYDGAALGRVFPISLDLVERIEFIPGPGGAVYGANALFGVINVVTRSGADVQGFEIESAVTTPDDARQGRITWGQSLANGLEVIASAAVYDAQGEDLNMTFPGAAADGGDLSGRAIGLDGEKDKEFMARVSKGPWSADVIYGNRHKDDPGATYLSDPLSGGYLKDRYVLSQAQYESPAAEAGFQHVSRVFFSDYRYLQPLHYDTLFVAGGASETFGLDSRVVATHWRNHKLLLGFEYQFNTRQDQSNEDVADPSNSLNIEGSGWRSGLYLQDEWRVHENVATTLGIRADRTDDSDTTLSPRIGLIWNATPKLVFKAMQGRAIRQPNAFERDYDDTGTSFTQVANPDLDHETIDTVEMSVDYRLRQDTRMRLSAYRWTIDKLITLEADPSGSGASQYRSGSDVEAQGIELSLLRSWDWGARLSSSLSLQRAEYENGVRLDNSPEVLGKLNFSSPLPIDGLRVSYELQYYGERQAIDGSDLDGYWLSNVLLAADGWITGLDLSLGVYNLLDERYEHPGSEINWQTAFEQDGRKAMLSLTYSR